MAKPRVSVVTLCAPAHLEGFGSLEGVANSKGEIFQSLPEQGTAVINSDDEFAPVWEQMASVSKRTRFGMSESADVTAGNIQSDADGSCFDLIISSQQVEVQLPLPGQHNIMNALAAAACATALNISLSDIRDGLQTMQSVSGRLEFKVGNQCTIIDDTYNANPASFAAAVDVLSKTSGLHWVVLGDMGELGESAQALHGDAGLKARSAGVERLYAIGDLTRHAVTEFGHEAKHFNNYETLIKIIKKDLEREQDKDVTLLIKGSRAAHMESVVQALEIEEVEHATKSC
jgi:UDP-N-acetylmuramoyl-tripeptide--D-alanyl-D-alanine ligase